MFRTMLAAAASLLVAASPLARADAKGDVTAAAKKLADTSYSWKSTTEGGFGGAQEGKTQKDGLTWVSLALRDNTVEIVKKGEQGAVKTQDGWQSLSDLGEEGAGRFIANMARNFRAPAAQAQEIAEKAKEIKKSDDGFEATLTEEQIKSMLAFRRRNAEGAGPQVANAKGSAKFWVKDGALTKMQYNVQGTMTVNNEDRDINRTTTVEFKDVGSTKIDVPAEAKSKAKFE